MPNKSMDETRVEKSSENPFKKGLSKNGRGFQIEPDSSSELEPTVIMPDKSNEFNEKADSDVDDFDLDKQKKQGKGTFRVLAEYLTRAIKEIQVKSLSDLSDVTPYFSLVVWLRVALYHALHYLLIGPFSFGIVALFSGKLYAENMGFGCSKRMVRFNIQASMNWLFLIIPAGMLLEQQIKSGSIRLTTFPLIIYICNITFRVFIVATRHGTTPPRVYRAMYETPITD
jgi:hypothetical protein